MRRPGLESGILVEMDLGRTATIKMTAEDYVMMVNGKLNGTMAFMKGQMKVTGNMMMAQKMQQIFPPNK